MSKSKKDVFALLKSLGFEGAPSDEAMAKVNEATGAKLLSQAMNATNVRKLETAEKKRDDRPPVTSNMGIFGSMLTQVAGRNDASKAMDVLEGDAKILAKSQAAINAFDRDTANRAENNALGRDNLGLFKDDVAHQRNLERDRAKEAGLNRRAAASDAIAAGPKPLTQDQINKWRNTLGKDLSAEEDSNRTTREIVALLEANPGLAPNQDYVANMNMSAKVGQSLGEEFLREADKKDATTKTYRHALKDPEITKKDNELIDAASRGAAPTTPAGHVELEAALSRDRMRRSSVDLAEMGKEDQEAFNSRRKEEKTAYGFELANQTFAEGTASFVFTELAQRQMGQGVGAQKELHTLMSRQATAEGLRIGGTTLTDFAVNRIIGELGDQPGMGYHNFIKAQNAHIRAQQGRVENILGRSDPRIIEMYGDATPGSVIHLKPIEMDAGPVKEVPTVDVNNPSALFNQSQEAYNSADLTKTAEELTAEPVGVEAGRVTDALDAGASKIMDWISTPLWDTENETKNKANRNKYGDGEQEEPALLNRLLDKQSSVLPKTMDIFKTPKNPEQANALAQTIAILQSQSQIV